MNAELLDRIYNCRWIGPREKRVMELKYAQGLKNYQIAMRDEPPYFPCSKETITRDLRRILKIAEPIITEYYSEHPEYGMPDS